MRRTNIYLSENQLTALYDIADGRGISVSEIIRRILDEYILLREIKAR